MATGNCRFYAQSEHEFIDRVRVVRLLAPYLHLLTARSGKRTTGRTAGLLVQTY